MKHGFTLLELIMVVAIVAVIAFVTTPLTIQFYQTQTLNGVQNQLLEVLGRARNKSVAQLNDSAFGVYLAASTSLTYTLFQGSTYATRTSLLDEFYDVPPSTTIVFPGNATTILFTKHTGIPVNESGGSATGTIVITRGGTTKTITVDEFGNSATP